MKIVLFFLCAATTIVADAQSYKQSMIPWRNHTLTWQDFMAPYPSQDTLAYEMVFHASPKKETKKIGHTTYEYITYDTYVNAAETWVKADCKTDDLLKLCQADFDLWELSMRKALHEYYSTTDVGADEVLDFHRRLCTRQQNEQYRKSQRGTDHAAVEQYAREVSNELAQTEIQPETYVAQLKPGRGLFYGIGLESHIPFISRFKPFYGMTASFGFYSDKGSMYGLEMNITGFSKCKEPLYTDKGAMEEGDNVWSYGMSLMYGRNMRSYGSTELTPYVSLGIRSYDGGELYEEYRRSRGSNFVERAGIAFGVGMVTDFILKHKVALKTRSYDFEELKSCLRVRPYLNVTYYPKDFGWVPALNVTIEFSQKTNKLRQ